MKFFNSITSGTIYVGLSMTLSLLCSCSHKEKVTLETINVTKGEISEVVTATGTLESITTVDVGTQVTGIVSQLFADFNSVVKKGELIAEIDKTTLESELRSANSTLESAKVTYEYTKTNYERDKQLHDKQLISDYEYETSRKDYLVAKSSYEKAQADRVRAARNLSYAEIYSPIDGIVVSREVEVGQTVVSSMNVANLYTIADLDNMRVVADVDEADIGSVKVGQNASFTVDAYPNDVFEGKVTQVRISPTTTSNVVTYEVLISTQNPEHKLIPGLTANVTIKTKEAKNVITIPLKVLRFTPQEFENGGEELPTFTMPHTEAYMKEGTDKPKDPAIPTDDMHRLVWVLRDNHLVPTEILLGVDNGINAEVVEGLQEGDKVAESYSTSFGEGQMSAGEAANSGSNSPFMPKPPGSDKKKRK